MKFEVTEYTVTMDEVCMTVILTNVSLGRWEIHTGKREIVLNSNLEWVDFRDMTYPTRFTLEDCNEILIRFVEQFRVKSL